MKCAILLINLSQYLLCVYINSRDHVTGECGTLIDVGQCVNQTDGYHARGACQLSINYVHCQGGRLLRQGTCQHGMTSLACFEKSSQVSAATYPLSVCAPSNRPNDYSLIILVSSHRPLSCFKRHGLRPACLRVNLLTAAMSPIRRRQKGPFCYAAPTI